MTRIVYQKKDYSGGGPISTSQIVDGAITSDKIADAAVTADKVDWATVDAKLITRSTDLNSLLTSGSYLLNGYESGDGLNWDDDFINGWTLLEVRTYHGPGGNLIYCSQIAHSLYKTSGNSSIKTRLYESRNGWRAWIAP